MYEGEATFPGEHHKAASLDDAQPRAGSILLLDAVFFHRLVRHQSCKMPPKSSTAAPKTVLDKIEHAVQRMADPTGSSRQAIVKFLKREFNVDNANAIKKALKTGVDSGRLVQKGQSFTLKGVEFKPPADEQVTIEEVKVGDGAVAEVGSEARRPGGAGGGIFKWKFLHGQQTL